MSDKDLMFVAVTSVFLGPMAIAFVIWWVRVWWQLIRIAWDRD